VIWLERIWQDIRHGARVFAKNPGFSAIALISIAFGTGANVAMFSVADALLLKPLPVARPDEVVTVGSKVRSGLAVFSVVSYPDYVDIRDRNRSFDGLVAFASRVAGFTVAPGAPPQMKMLTMVSENFFRVLGVEPQIGRSFRPDEDRVPGRDAVVVLSDGLWQQEFGGDPSALGRTVRIAGIEFTVIGVAPEQFTGLDQRFRGAAYVPLAMWPKLMNSPAIDPLTTRDFRNLTMKGRLKPNVTLVEAQAELTTMAKDLERAYPDTNTNQALTVQTELQLKFERNPLDNALLVLLTTLSVAVLCVACANVGGLLASRAPVRAREIALRLAIGAGRPRLVRQLITEILSITFAGGLGGLAVGYAGIILMRQIEYPTDVVAVPVVQLDERTMFFSLALAMGSAFLFGLSPAIQMTRVDLVGSLKSTDVSSTRRQRLTGRSMLVSIQVALSLVLVTVALYTFQVFHRALTQGPGFRTTHLAKLSIDTSQARYGESQWARFFERLVDDAGRLNGVRSATITSAIPLFSFDVTQVRPEGFHLPPEQKSVRTYGNSVDEHYFATMGIPILAGRDFRATDTPDSARVSIVNETFARHYWPAAAISDVVGKRFRLNDEHGPWIEIVGVATTSTYGYFAEPPQDAVYFPFRQRPRGNMVLLAETNGESATVLAPLREMVRRMDAEVPLYDVQTMEVFYDARVTSIGNVIIRMTGALGLMGITLTMVGLYGLVSYAVSRRTREIGIRIAVGASYRRVVGLILRQGMAPAWFGLAAGLVLSALTTRLLAALIPVNHQYDPQSFYLAVPILLVVTLLAAFIPARRAARLDPTIALRGE
jgi:predicted permease